MTSTNHHCSTIVLCLASVCALTSVAFMALAFSTDNWQHISVDREIIVRNVDNTSTLNTDFRFFDRVKGIFR